jgi:hypothetical protein
MDVVTLRRLKTNWQSTEVNPDEDFLKRQFMAEVANLEQSFVNEEETFEAKKKNLTPLITASRMQEAEIENLLRRDADAAKRALSIAERRLQQPALDYTVLQKQDIEQVRKNFEQQGRAFAASAVVWNPSYGGWWSVYNGESEEAPNATISVGSKRVDPRAQAYGEDWYDADYSEIHAYLAFRFTPPTWGHLHVYAYPWLHGYYSMYADDAWYKSEYARAEVDTWVDVHQNFWRPRQYSRRFTRAGYEIHPTESNRIDRQYGHVYTTNVGGGDPVTIRVGVRLYCLGKASGGSALLNFQAGAANYVYVPYVQLYLHQ